MFLIRIAFWVALIVILLPTDQRQQAQLYSVASETAHRIATFCERNTAVCERGGEYWVVFKQKLEFGAKLAYDLASERLSGHTADTEKASSSAERPAKVERTRGTLMPADMVPDWRGKAAKSGA